MLPVRLSVLLLAYPTRGEDMHYSAKFSCLLRCLHMGAIFGGVVLPASLLWSHTASADDGFSREEIMQRHQVLAQKHLRSSDLDSDTDVADESDDAPSSGTVPLTPPASAVVAGQSGTDKGLVARLLVRVNELEGQVREMHGQIDLLNNQMQQNMAAMNKQLADMQFTMENNARQAAAAVVKAAPKVASVPVKAKSISTHEQEEALQAGRNALKNQRYKEADIYAHKALKMAQGTWSKIEAQFLLAQALAGQKAYKNAALTYYDVYSRNPESSRAPEALLGVSASMLALGNKPAACEALQRLAKEFPKASSRVRASEKIFRERAACR